MELYSCNQASDYTLSIQTIISLKYHFLDKLAIYKIFMLILAFKIQFRPTFLWGAKIT